MDNIRFYNKLSALKVQQRNQAIMEMVAWLESTARPTVKPEHLSFLIDFENQLQQQLNQPSISNGWSTTMMQTYGSFPFYEAFLKKF